MYFDNLVVNINAGNIIEENHYYAFGLKIAGISSKKLGDANEGNLQNNYQFEGGFSEMDLDIGWEDFALRNYDSQIGRWIQQDPYQEFASPYLAMGNDPISNIDPSGGDIFEGISLGGKMLMGAIAGGVAGIALDAAFGGDGTKGGVIGVIVGTLAPGVAEVTLRVAISMGLHAVNIATNILESTVYVEQVGKTNGGRNNPKYTIEQLIKFGIKSDYFKALLDKAGIDKENYKSQIEFGEDDDELGTYTNSVSGKITLDPNESFNSNVIGLAHELTNLSLRLEYVSLSLKVMTGKISPEKYAVETNSTESNALFSQFKVAKELNIKKLGNRYANKLLRKYRKGKISDEELLKIIQKNGAEDYNPKSGKKTIDVYKQLGEELRKNFQKLQSQEIGPPHD